MPPPNPTDPNYDLWQLGQTTGQLPWRGMSDADLNRFNSVMRSSPVYQNFMLSHGLPTTGNVRLSGNQQRDLEQALKQAGFPISGGMHIDQGGNVNQINTGPRNVALGAAVAGGGYLGGSYLAPLLAGGGGAGAAGGLTAPMVAAPAASAGTAAGGGVLASTPLVGTLAPYAGTAAASGVGAGTAAGAGLGTAALGGTGPSLAPYAAPVAASGTGAAAGGTSLSQWLDRIGAGGRIAGAAAQGMATNRANDNFAQTQRGQLLASLYGTQQNASLRAQEAASEERMRQADIDLRQRQFGLDAPSARGRQSVRGSLMANLQPASFSGLPEGIARTMPTITGGLTPAALSPEVREMGRVLQRDALLNQLKGDTFAAQTPTDFKSSLIAPPQLAELEQSGLLENILGGGGFAGSLIGALSEPVKKRTTNPYEEEGRT